ncbi:WAT1-related protein At3g30340-like [Hordeum vulgare subsp. vulgare]|uniref:WAT1-related protein At3g30340-like n=1 Tax=Hordeum vulgare subsp. vulgare TaxID=112509 RepID=UPI001D1A331E|nr:WAT1-related protein At3g30340-like [Hordeum vulgare subsp. vulgare]
MLVDQFQVCAESMGWMELLKPVAAMIAFDTLFAVMTVLVKKALDGGLNPVVLIALRQLVGAAFLAPIAYFKERNVRPRFTKEIFAYLFMSALLGALFAQYLFFLGLSYTTATLAATVSNMTPVFTFLIAIPLRSETVDVRSKAGLAKIAGTLASVGGAILLSLYKGAALTHASSSAQEHAGNGTTGTSGSKGRWLLGSALLLLNCITFSLWMLLQGKLTKKYPAVISSTAFMALFSSLQAGALAVTTQRRLSVWLLRGSIQIATVLFAGVGVSGIGYVLMTWCIEKRGPVFTAGFLPLIQIIAGVLDLLVLHEQLYVGRSTRPKLTLEILTYLFFSAVFGAALSQYTFFYGLQYTTATFAITFINLSPVLTFLIAVVLRMEPLKLKSMAGAAKIVGTLTSLAGLLLLSLYKGVPLTHQATTAHGPAAHHAAAASNGSGNRSWMLGTVALLFNCLCFSFWLLLQTKLTKKYPAIYSNTAIMFFISTLQGGAVTLAMERHVSLWMLTSKLEIITVLYAGIVGSGAGYLIMTWCVEKKGPVFTAAFIPMIQIMVATIDFFFLHEQIYLGSVLGSVLMILGLYLVLWGKKRDAASVACTTTTNKQVEEQADDKP